MHWHPGDLAPRCMRPRSHLTRCRIPDQPAIACLRCDLTLEYVCTRQPGPVSARRRAFVQKTGSHSLEGQRTTPGSHRDDAHPLGNGMVDGCTCLAATDPMPSVNLCPVIVGCPLSRCTVQDAPRHELCKTALGLVGDRGLRPPAAEQLVDRRAPRTVFRFASLEHPPRTSTPNSLSVAKHIDQ